MCFFLYVEHLFLYQGHLRRHYLDLSRFITFYKFTKKMAIAIKGEWPAIGLSSPGESADHLSGSAGDQWISNAVSVVLGAAPYRFVCRNYRLAADFIVGLARLSVAT